MELTNITEALLWAHGYSKLPYLYGQFGTIRHIRCIDMVIALIVPALDVSIVNFNQIYPNMLTKFVKINISIKVYVDVL